MPVGKEPAAGGEGDGIPAVFDAKAFREELLGEFKGELNKTLNGFAKTMKSDFEKLVKPSADPPPGDAPTPGGGEPKGGEPAIKDPAVNAIVQRLNADLASLKKENSEVKAERQAEQEKRLESERVSAIRTSMQSIDFVSDSAREDFFRSVTSDIKRADDGTLVADTGKGPVTADEYIRQQSDARPYLLKARGAGGSGASAGTRTGTGAIDITNMNSQEISKLPADKRAALGREMAAVLTGASQ